MDRDPAFVECDHDKLAAPRNGFNPAPRDPLSQLRAIPGRHESRSKACRHDAPPD
jgi:hypothetical protein